MVKQNPSGRQGKTRGDAATGGTIPPVRRSSRRKYRVSISWDHAKFGPQHTTVTGEGTSIRRGISNALLAFFTDKSAGAKARRDAHAEIRIIASRTKEPADR